MKNVLFIIFCLLALPSFSFGQEKIDINTANLDQLEIIAGIGPVYAQRIIGNRPFSSVDDLLKVSGIGEKTLQKIKEQGLAYVNLGDNNSPAPLDRPPEKRESLQIDYPENIYFIEIMPSPEGPDEENEYIRIKNFNDFEVDLADWKIIDTIGTSKIYALSQKIAAQETLSLPRSETKITLNNSGDGLQLLNPKDDIIDFVEFGRAEAGAVFIKSLSGWRWNTSPIQNNPDTESGPEPLPDPKKEGIEIDLSKEDSKRGLSAYGAGIFTVLLLLIAFIYLKKKVW